MKISKTDSRYPHLLLTIKDPPNPLYVYGSLDDISFKNCIAVVGSRNMSPYGAALIDKFINELSFYDCSVVSGFTRGVDRYAHKISIKNMVPTVAVLPFGVDETSLAADNFLTTICSNSGNIISEYPAEFKATKWSFVRRNRIIAGMSLATIVIEASENSGSLITANLAHKYSRPVFVIPGNIFSSLHKGIYQLIKSYAIPVASGSEIGEYLALTPKRSTHFTNKELATLTKNEENVMSTIRAAPLDAEHLHLYTSIDKTELLPLLLSLQHKGNIYIKEGRYYVKES